MLADTRTLREAKAWVVSKVGGSYTEWMFGQGSSTWDRWLCRHEPTFIRTMIGWQMQHTVDGTPNSLLHAA